MIRNSMKDNTITKVDPTPASARDKQAHAGQLRQQATAAFDAAGYPTRKTEEWRFNPIKLLTDTPYTSTSELKACDVIPTRQQLAPCWFDEVAGVLVFLNGRYIPSLSQLPQTAGVELMEINQFAQQQPESYAQLLGRPTLHDDPIAHLNMSQFDSGVVLVVDGGVTLDKPIHLLMLATTSEDAQPWVAHSRNLIHVGSHSSVTVIEQYAALPGSDGSHGDDDDAGIYWHNAVTQIHLEDHAHAEHYFLDEEGPQARNVSTLLARLGERAHLHSHTALVGGLMERNNIHVELRGRHADALVNGLFVGTDNQTMDNHMRVVHGSPDCDSRQFYKGILADHAHGIFTGRIVVEQDAQKTDAKQTNRNLVLSDTARIHTNPQLEIYADDVKCTHGATTGQLDADALFYLQSRGISRQQAKAMLIHAFASESLDRMTCEPVRQRLIQQIDDKLARIHAKQENQS